MITTNCKTCGGTDKIQLREESRSNHPFEPEKEPDLCPDCGTPENDEIHLRPHKYRPR